MSDDRPTYGSGNVFLDLGFEDPEGEREKARLVRAIRSAMAERRFSLEEASDLAGLAVQDVEAILAGRVDKIPQHVLVACSDALDSVEHALGRGRR